MRFAEAIAAMIDGSSARRAAWGPRRAVKLAPAPWCGEERLLVFDLMNKGDVPPHPWPPKGEDVRGDDWEIVNSPAVTQ